MDITELSRLVAQRRFGEAQQLYTQLSAKESGSAELLRLGAAIAASSSSPAHALALLERAVRLAPGNAGLHADLAQLYQQTGQFGEAAAQWRRCHLLVPHNLDVLERVAQTSDSAGHWAEAADAYLALHRAGRRTPHLKLRLAAMLHSLRRVDEAEPYFQELMREAQTSPVRWEYDMQLLLTGRFDPGWDYYEDRFTVFGHDKLHCYAFPYPAWNGQPLAGKTLLLHGEQGLGDEIMYCSLVNELSAQAKRVIVACAPALVDLFRHSFPNAEIVAHPRGSPEQWRHSPPQLPFSAPPDYQVPMGSAPRFLRRRLSDFDGARAYLAAEPQRVAAFEARLRESESGKPPFRIGLVWSGNLRTGAMGQRKSIPLALFKPFCGMAGARFVSLQNADYGDQTGQLPELRIADFSRELTDFSATAALAACMDLIIAVDTSVVHLVGAMGKPTWLPLWQAADWRWLWQADRSIWYPDVHLFRQSVPGDWQPVIDEMQRRLAERLRSSAPAAA